MNKKLKAIGILLVYLIVGISGCLDLGDVTKSSITSFNVEPSMISEGETANLSWVVMSAETVSIDNGIGNVSNIGERIIIPTETTVYTLTARNGTKTLTATTQIIVVNNTNEVNDNDTSIDDDSSDEDNESQTNETSNPIALIDTSKGTIKLELFLDKTPKTCENFIKLANEGFFDGLIFHRVMDDFMIQAGNTYPDGSTKESPYGNIVFEANQDITHIDGAISMASTGAGIGGSSQFFICDGKQSGLDGSYAVFGKTIEGLDVVRDIADEPHDSSYGSVGGGRPDSNIIINSITIED